MEFTKCSTLHKITVCWVNEQNDQMKGLSLDYVLFSTALCTTVVIKTLYSDTIWRMKPDNDIKRSLHYFYDIIGTYTVNKSSV